MLFFTTARHDFILDFKKLSECEEECEPEYKNYYLNYAEKWAKKVWGYLHIMDENFHKNDLMKNCDKVYIAFFLGKPVGMFSLIEKKFDPLEIASGHKSTFAYLDYVFIEERYRGFGFGKQLIIKAKDLAKEMRADLIYLDTLTPGLNNLYLKQKAEVVCENHYNTYPTEVLSIKLS